MSYSICKDFYFIFTLECNRLTHSWPYCPDIVVGGLDGFEYSTVVSGYVGK